MMTSTSWARSLLLRKELLPGGAGHSLFLRPMSSVDLPSALRNPSSKTWSAPKLTKKDYLKHQRLTRANTEAKGHVPNKFSRYDPDFDRVVHLETQLESLKVRGFLRPLKEYEVPEKAEELFMEVCRKEGIKADNVSTLPESLLTPESKSSFLTALEESFHGHRVPNSMLHIVDSASAAWSFYSAPVQMSTPYEKMHKEKEEGRMPKNLHIQLEPKRFDPSGDHPFDRVTAFPKSTTILVTPEGKKKYQQQEHLGNPFPSVESEKDKYEFLKLK